MSTWTVVIIILGLLGGVILTLVAARFPADSILHVILVNLGSGVTATALISIALDLVWGRERAKEERKELEPLYDRFRDFADRLSKLEGRLEVFKTLGLNYCYASRRDALGKFFGYAKDIVDRNPSPECDGSDISSDQVVNIVSSSARGLMGYLDRETLQVQKQWRELITEQPQRFRILLTHPAYAHLRQPAEERSSGDIELEILKTAIYLHCIAGMDSSMLRFYRGSPTVFLVQAGKHILVNPYPYGKMAMNTLCLEFESSTEDSYVFDFAHMHFNHTWAFLDQPSKLVDQRRLVQGVATFDDIISAFSECTFLSNPKCLRLTEAQVVELDTFISTTLRTKYERFKNEPPCDDPFMAYVKENDLECSSPGPGHQSPQDDPARS